MSLDGGKLKSRWVSAQAGERGGVAGCVGSNGAKFQE